MTPQPADVTLDRVVAAGKTAAGHKVLPDSLGGQALIEPGLNDIREQIALVWQGLDPDGAMAGFAPISPSEPGGALAGFELSRRDRS